MKLFRPDRGQKIDMTDFFLQFLVPSTIYRVINSQLAFFSSRLETRQVRRRESSANVRLCRDTLLFWRIASG